MENKTESNLGAIILSLIFFGLILLIAWDVINHDVSHGEYISHSIHPVDQIFRGNNDLIIYYEQEDKSIKEVRYWGNSCGRNINKIEKVPEEIANQIKVDGEGIANGFKIFRDLSYKERGFAIVIKYYSVVAFDSNSNETYVVVHLPENQDISPGLEHHGKFGTFQIKEIK